MPAAKGEARGDVAVTRDSAGVLVVRLSGRWELAGGLPPFAKVEPEIARGGVRKIAFDASALESWDSAAVAFLVRIEDVAREKKLELDRGSLPDGMVRLLELAAAVPERPGTRRSAERPPILERLGAGAIGFAAGSHEGLVFVGEVASSFGRLVTGRARFRLGDLALLVQECGAMALPIVTLISILVGMILAFVGSVQLERFGAQIYVADLVSIAMVREMGCIMTGIIMAGRTGSGFAAQLGTMKVTQELDAFTTLGISPIDFLVLPRILALSMMMPLLTLYSDWIGIFGGGIVSVGMLDLTALQYLNGSVKAVTATSFSIGIGKSLVFGVLIAIAGCLRGMQCGKSSSAVGDAATSAVVTSIVALVVADGLFAVIFNVLKI